MDNNNHFSQPKIFFIIIIVLLAIIKCFFLITSFHEVGWDESVYLGMGKYIYSQGEIGLWEEIRPPLLPLLLGLCWKISLPYVVAANILIFLFTAGTLLLVYLITKQFLQSDYYGLLSVLLLVMSSIFIENSYQILTEIPAVFFILLAYYLITKQHYFLTGIMLALGFLTKYPAGIYVIPLMIIIGVTHYKNLKLMSKYVLKCISGFAVLTIPFLIINSSMYSSITKSFLKAVFYPLIQASLHQGNPVHAIQGAWANLFYYGKVLAMDNIFLIVALIPIICLCANLNIKNNNMQYKNTKQSIIQLMLLVAVPLFYFTSIINKQQRFSIVFLPFIAILASIGIYLLLGHFKSSKIQYIKIVLVSLMIIYVAHLSFSIGKLYFKEQTPLYVEEYYQYFSKNNISQILATEPQFAAYDDIRVIPMYNNIEDANIIYTRHKDKVQAIAYYDDFFPCNTEECNKEKQLLKQQLFKDFNFVLTSQQWTTKYILIK